MNEDQFSAMLAIIVPPIIEQITKNSNVDDEKAIYTLKVRAKQSARSFRMKNQNCGTTAR